MKHILLFFSFIMLSSCKVKEQTKDSFSQEIIESIKNKDAEKIYALFMTAEETAIYGFETTAISSEEMANLKSPEEYFKLIADKSNKNKAFEIKTINQYINHFNTLFDWKKVNS